MIDNNVWQVYEANRNGIFFILSLYNLLLISVDLLKFAIDFVLFVLENREKENARERERENK